jgi:NAD dependent epimerase/dehydratase family enzyme
MKEAPMKALMTGGTGLLGSELLANLTVEAIFNLAGEPRSASGRWWR